MAGKKAASLEVVHPDCAGIDVGKRKHYVAVDPSRFEDPVRNFGTFTCDLEAMAEWLGACGVRQVAMESTGVYWIPVYFCSWLGLAPGTRISGDKRLGDRPARQTNRVGQALRMAASTARNSKTAIGAAHRRRLSRMDSAKAVKATAHQLARLIYAMLTRGEEYVERDLADMETERRDRQIKHLQRQARHFDLALVPAEQAA